MCGLAPTLSANRPTHGTIKFRNYSLRHRSHLQSAIKNINLIIESKQKIGIIGRTDAGKSSLIKGLFRFIDQYFDEQCWKVLEDVQLKQFVNNHSNDLQMCIGVSGDNFSIGQCQLINIAHRLSTLTKCDRLENSKKNE
ncbi:hypothetical protein I4U23_027163 [Adineta vaga]|nr:hypothetical protein I4U23_027163 [Adineta vaga]